ncbi:MAG TPA: maleylacetoacetate isomerase [Acetobacteraceae bacterium]|nr:maleylacetoacetate isomerase [Acetobacteraceae bacterium]
MKLYTYFRSSAVWRVRIALGLKGLEWTPEFVHLLRDGGEQLRPAYRAKNPTALVPTLETDDGALLGQSLAIMEWLEETHPEPPLLPGDALQRARIRAFALTVACDIHPLNNLRVLRYLKNAMGQDDAARDEWYRHWIAEGLTALEAMVCGNAGPFCFGAAPTLADVCLVPQLSNARRFNCPLDAYPTLLRADAAAGALPAFAAAAPDRQPDAS